MKLLKQNTQRLTKNLLSGGCCCKASFCRYRSNQSPSSALKLDVIEHLHDPVFFPLRSIVADNLLIYLRNNGVPSRKNDDVSCWRHRPPADAVGGSGWATPPFCGPDNDFSFLVFGLEKKNSVLQLKVECLYRRCGVIFGWGCSYRTSCITVLYLRVHFTTWLIVYTIGKFENTKITKTLKHYKRNFKSRKNSRAAFRTHLVVC